MQKVKKNFDYWMTKKLSLAGKFQNFSKVLASIHVHYSSCWVLYVNCYKKLEKLLWDFLWASSSNRNGFHRVSWDIYFSARPSRWICIFYFHMQGIALCVKWIINALEGIEAWKVLIKYFITSIFLLNQKSWWIWILSLLLLLLCISRFLALLWLNVFKRCGNN